jgi:hypothetical protein
MVNESVALDSRANFTKDIATTVMIRHFVRYSLGGKRAMAKNSLIAVAFKLEQIHNASVTAGTQPGRYLQQLQTSAITWDSIS